MQVPTTFNEMFLFNAAVMGFAESLLAGIRKKEDKDNPHSRSSVSYSLLAGGFTVFYSNHFYSFFNFQPFWDDFNFDYCNVGSTIVKATPPPPMFFFRGGVASQLLIFGPNSPHKSKRQIKTIQPQLNE